MLQSIRERAHGFLAWVIVVLIAIPFALWGIQQYFHGGGEVVVASVNGRDVTRAEVERLYQQRLPQLQALLGDRFNEGEVKLQVLDGLVNRILLLQATQESGLRIGDARLAAQIHSQPAFQNQGRFDAALYAQVLRSQGLDPGEFEERLRQALLMEQPELGLERTAAVTAPQLSRYLALHDQRRQISHIVIPVARFSGSVDVGEQDIAAYYDEHRDRFVTPEQVSLDYLDLSVDELAKGVPPPSEEALQRLYEERKSEFGVDEQRRASHILVVVPQNADAQAVAAAQKKAEDLLQRIKTGESFSDLAKQFSEDPGSAKQGGDLGFFGRGVMDPAFEQAVFSMSPGDLRVVKSQYGFHVVRLEEIRPASVQPFEQVRARLVADAQRREAERLFLDRAERLADLTYEHPDSLETAAQQLELPVKTTELFDRNGGGQGIAANDKVRQAAFSSEVLKEGYNSEPIELEPGRLIVLRVKEHRASAPRPLDEVRGEIEQELRVTRARQKAEQTGQAMLDELRAGANPEQVAQAEDLKWESPVTIKRDDRSLNAELVRKAFALPRPDRGASTYGGLAFPSGDYVVVQVLSVEDGSPDGVDSKERQVLRQSLARDQGREEFGAWMAALRSQADVAVYADRL